MVAYVRLGEPIQSGNDITEETTGNLRIIRIPIMTNLKDINSRAVKEIDFNANALFTRGSHSFIVYDIRLIRP